MIVIRRIEVRTWTTTGDFVEGGRVESHVLLTHWVFINKSVGTMQSTAGEKVIILIKGDPGNMKY